MALSLGRAGSRVAGVAARALLTASQAAKGGAGLQIPSAGVRELLPRLASLLPPSSLVAQAMSSQSRAAHTLVMVVVQADPEVCPEYAESLSKAVKNQVAILDKEFRTSGSDSKVSSNEVKPDEPVKCAEKQQQEVSFVTDGKLCVLSEEEMETLFDDKTRAAFGGHKDDRCLAAIELMGKNIDVALYGVKWQQQTCFEKLEAGFVAQRILLEDLRSFRPRKNFVDSLLSWVGQKIFPRKVIMARRHLLALVPYGSKYYFYGMFVYSLLTSEIPLGVVDYSLIVMGAQWVAADELKEKLTGYHSYYKNGGKKVNAGKEAADSKDAGEKV